MIAMSFGVFYIQFNNLTKTYYAEEIVDLAYVKGSLVRDVKETNCNSFSNGLQHYRLRLSSIWEFSVSQMWCLFLQYHASL